MIELVIDTATQALSLALFRDGARVAHHHEVLGRGHAEHLIPRIAAFPGGGRADRVLVDSGPGSFTGVRVGIAAARALAFAWGSTLRSYSGLAMIAAMARDQGADAETICAVLTGGHGELFWQCFSGADLSPLAPPASTPVAELANVMRESIVYGPGAHALIDARGWGTALAIYPDAGCRALLSDQSIIDAARPLYGRGADAKPPVRTAPSCS